MCIEKFHGTSYTLSVHVRKLVENTKETPNADRIEINLARFRMTMNRDIAERPRYLQVVASRANAPIRTPSF